MAKFKFRLARVSKIKHVLEEQALNKWAQANSALHAAKNSLAKLQLEKEQAKEFGYTQLDIKLRPQLYDFLNTMDQKISKQEEEVQRCLAREQEAREKWMQARQEKEIFIKLEEKQYERYLYEESRQEQNRLDELKNKSVL